MSYPRARKFRRRLVNPFTGEDMGRQSCWKDLSTHVIPLYAHEDLSLPSASDLLDHGSAEVHRWLASLGVKPPWGEFWRHPAIAAYEEHWRHHLLGTRDEMRWHLWMLGRGRTFATLGGWPGPLFHDSDEPAPEGRLLLVTFAQTEPQRQVWVQPDGSLRVVDLIT